MSAPRKAAFLDRDGVINVDHAYVHRWEDFEFVPGAVGAMRRLHEAGYLLVVVTNQSGIARGLYGEAEFQALTQQMCAALGDAGAPVAAVYHCPHLPDAAVPALAVDCNCRKPRPGMILQAAGELGIDLASSLLVGDKLSDIEAANAAGIGRAYLIESRYVASSVDGAAGGPVIHGCFPALQACVAAVLPSPA